MKQENEIEVEKLSPTTDFIPSDGASCSGFERPTQETWRWYAWTRMKRSEPLRWIPTVWKADTEAGARQQRERALMEDETLILVRETVTYIHIPNDTADLPATVDSASRKDVIAG
jgi:hypothetical protein